MVNEGVEVAGSKVIPGSVDVHVGKRLKLFRDRAGVTPGDLAASVGLTLQQIQQHEAGLTRIRASTLYDISGILGVKIREFFEGYESGGPMAFPLTTENAINLATDPLSASEGLRLNRAFVKIRDKTARSRLIAMAESMADFDDVEE